MPVRFITACWNIGESSNNNPQEAGTNSTNCSKTVRNNPLSTRVFSGFVSWLSFLNNMVISFFLSKRQIKLADINMNNNSGGIIIINWSVVCLRAVQLLIPILIATKSIFAKTNCQFVISIITKQGRSVSQLFTL